jgi:hypothetical protein
MATASPAASTVMPGRPGSQTQNKDVQVVRVDDFDVVLALTQRGGETIHQGPSGEHAFQPVDIGLGQRVGGLLVVAAAGADRSELSTASPGKPANC